MQETSSYQDQEDLGQSLFCLVAAAVLLTVCSRSSFLYAFNIWDDANSYLTVGKSIFRGLVPYRDLFDQKGILLYFLYGIASLFSATTFHAVFVLEVLAAFFSLLAIMKTLRLFLRTQTTALVLTPLAGAVIYSSRCFYWGGSAEEFLFPFLMWGIYLSLRYFRRGFPVPMRYRTVLLGGVLAGAVFHIKFSSLGLFFAFALSVLLADLIGEGHLRAALLHGLTFLGGMGLATLPWLLYFGANGAIRDWLYVYIYKNVFEYSEKLPLADRLYRFYRILIDHWLNNRLAFDLIAAGFLYLAVCAVITLVTGRDAVSVPGIGMLQDASPEQNAARGRRHGLHRFCLCLSVAEFLNLASLFFFLTLVIFIGGVNLPYYSFPMTAFVLTAAIAAGYLLEGLFGMLRTQEAVDATLPGKPGQADSIPSPNAFAADNTGRAKQDGLFQAHRVFLSAAAIASLLLSFFMVWTLSMNTSYRRVRQEDLWLYRFRDYIAASGVKAPGILNMNCFDAGLYTVTDATPVCYYFQTQTLNMEEVIDVQKACMRTDAVDFILSRDISAEGLRDRYELVLTDEIMLPDFCHTYYLYQKKEYTR